MAFPSPDRRSKGLGRGAQLAARDLRTSRGEGVARIGHGLHSSFSCCLKPCFSAASPTRRLLPCPRAISCYRADMSSEIIFEVTEADEGGYCASALGFGIHTQGETLEELRTMVRDAVSCYFDTLEQTPNIIRLHFVRDEVLAR